jgi:hypothetical protein
MYVSPKQFFNRGFTCGCVLPLGLFVTLYITDGDWLTATWQTVMLLAACVIRYQHCCISTLKERYVAALEDLRDEAGVNLALIEYIKDNLPETNNETKE